MTNYGQMEKLHILALAWKFLNHRTHHQVSCSIKIHRFRTGENKFGY